MATISLMFRDKILANYQMGRGDTLLIGRNKINDIVIDNLAVSSQHAKIESDGNGFLFIDLKSENGSFAGDELIKSRWLNDGDEITIGKHFLKFSNPKISEKIEKHSSVINKTMQMDTKAFRDLIRKNKQKSDQDDASVKDKDTKQNEPLGALSFLSEDWENFELKKKSITIGKAAKSDVRVKGIGVGKTAAVINSLPDGWYLSPVGGISKPRLNNEIVKKSIKLKSLDIISVGATKLQFLLE